jgi:hypothetical protein
VHKNDERLLKAALGALGVIGSAFGRNQAVAIPVALESIALSGGSILLETMDMLDEAEKKEAGRAKLVIRPMDQAPPEDASYW